MPAAPLPPDEPARLDALRRLNVLDTPPEAGFDDLTRLAAHVCDTPIAVISLVDADRLWFKSTFGLDADGIPRGGTLCEHAVASGELFVVPDTAADERFADAGIVAGPPHARFYAGMPLVTPDGFAIGTLCVLDRTPRTLTPAQADALRMLARQVVAQFLLRTRLREQAKDHETFRVLFEQSSDAHLIFDERDGIIDCNQATVAMLRLSSKDEVLALHPAALSPEFQPCGRRSMDKCVDMDATARRDGCHRFDWTHTRADGEQFSCEVTLTPVELHGRSVLLVVWHDLTERKRAEDTLRASEERFRAFMDASPIAAFMKDEGGRYTYINEPIVRRFGRPADFWLGKTDAELFPAAYSGVWRENDLRVLAGGRVEEFNESVPTEDGGVSHWTSWKFPFRDAGGQEHLAGLAVDVTEKRKTEDALRESEGRFRAVVEQAADAVFLTAPDGAVADVNRRACDSLGYARDELVGTTFRRFDPFLDAAAHARLMTDLTAGGTVCFESRHRRKDGSEFPVEIRMGTVELHGRPHRMSIARDITDRKRAEDALRESEARFRTIVGQASDAFFLHDASGRVVDVNRRACDSLGYTPDELVGMSPTDYDPTTSPERVRAIGAELDAGRAVAFDTLHRRKDGSQFAAEVRIAPCVVGGRPHSVALVRDITDRKRAEAELRESEGRFRSVVDDLAEGVVLLDYQTRAVVQANRAFLDLLGYTADEAAALTQYDFVAHDRADIDHRMAAVVRDGRHDLGFRKYRRKGGAVIDVSVNGSRLELNGRTVLSLVVRDMSAEVAYEQQLVAYQAELERANVALHALATTDRLTGVSNRGAFNDKLTEAFDRAVRYAHPLSVILLDVDHFKQFNDTFGHPAGDAVLQRVATLLRHTVRGTDTVARYGGEEFVVLLPDTDHAGAMLLAERLRRAIAGGSWEKRPITISVGVSTLTPDTSDAAALVQEADQALYRSKQAGRNRVNHGSTAIPQMATTRTPVGG